EHALKSPNRRKNGWAVSPKQLDPHSAAFTLAEPYTPTEGTELEITLDHQFEFNYPGFSIGRFRLSLTLDTPPSLTGELAAELRVIFMVPAEKRTPGQLEYVLAYYAAIAPSTTALRDQLDALQKKIAAVPAAQTPIMKELPQDKQRPNKVHVRGNFLDQGDVVQPAVPPPFHPFPP